MDVSPAASAIPVPDPTGALPHMQPAGNGALAASSLVAPDPASALPAPFGDSNDSDGPLTAAASAVA